MGWLIIVGSIPIVVLGLLFQDPIETTFRDLRIVAIALVVFSLILYWADRVGAKKRRADRPDRAATASLFGLAQAMALIPGVSRSGGTITAGLFLGYTREAAARYSFLLAIPAVLGSGFSRPTSRSRATRRRDVEWGPTILATVIAFAVGLARDRLAAALPDPRQLHAVRRLPDRAGPAGARAGRRRRPRARRGRHA